MRPNTSTSHPRRKRDPRLDIVRGLALLCVYIDHVPGNFLANLTLRAFALCDASEVLVMTSGTAMALAYFPLFRLDPKQCILRIARRIGLLYVAQLAIAVSTIGALLLAAHYFKNPAYYEHSTLRLLPNDISGSVIGLLTLSLQPGFLHILPLYVVFLAWVPLMLLLMRKSILLPLIPSLAVWIIAQQGVNLFATNEATGWYFNPLAWQLLFVIGLVVGAAKAKGASPPRNKAVNVIAWAIIVVGFILAAPWAQLPALSHWSILGPDGLGVAAKQNLSALRVVSVVALAYATAHAMHENLGGLGTSFAKFLAKIGRNGLTVFCVATALDEWLLIARLQGAHGITYQLVVNVGGIAILWGVAVMLESKPKVLETMRERIVQLIHSALPVTRPSTRPNIG